MATARTLGRRLLRFATVHRGDLIGLSIIAVLVVAFLTPAVKDGFSFGTFDFDTGTQTPFGAGLYHVVHSPQNGDAVSQMISWNTLDWRLIHHGQFPLWNEFSALGMPAFFNFESAVLSLPDLVSYLFPLRFAFLVVVAMTFFIAGSGTYCFGRVVGLRVPAATFAGVSFMFAGAFASWITWPLGGVLAWTGWIGAFAILSYRHRRRFLYPAGLAVSVAFSLYAGFPEANVMLVLAFSAAALVCALVWVLRRRHISLVGVGRVVVASALGGLLAAPLWWPGLQVIAGAHRQDENNYVGLPFSGLALLFSQGYFGVPIGANVPRHFQLVGWNYYESVTYVGIAALVLFVVGLAEFRKRPIVVGLLAGLIVCLFATYESQTAFHLFESVVDHLGQLSRIRFERIRTLTAFFFAILAGFGLQAMIERGHTRPVRRAFTVGAVLATIPVAWLLVDALTTNLDAADRHQRLDALVWPLAMVALMFVVAEVIRVADTSTGRRRTFLATASAAGLGIGQLAFLFFAGVGIPSYSHLFYATTPVERQFAGLVGTNLVGLDGGNTAKVRAFTHIGFLPNVNIGYGIHLFAIHDPLIPAAYFFSWPNQAAAKEQFGVGQFVPDVDSAAVARRYGITYVLSKQGRPVPPGMVKVAVLLDGETLYSVPRSAQFTIEGGAGRVGPVANNGNGSYEFRATATTRSTLALRVTALPGWHATIDGRVVAVSTYEQVMESTVLPAGTHEVRLWYRPDRFGEGIDLALGASGLLVLWALLLAVPAIRRRRAGRVVHVVGGSAVEAPPLVVGP